MVKVLMSADLTEASSVTDTLSRFPVEKLGIRTGKNRALEDSVSRGASGGRVVARTATAGAGGGGGGPGPGGPPEVAGGDHGIRLYGRRLRCQPCPAHETTPAALRSAR